MFRIGKPGETKNRLVAGRGWVVVGEIENNYLMGMKSPLWVIKVFRTR